MRRGDDCAAGSRGNGRKKNGERDGTVAVEFKGMAFWPGDGLYSGMSENESFLRGGLHGMSRAVKAEMHDAAVCVIFEDMFKHLDGRSELNKQLRIGYLWLKRAYCEGDREKENLFVEEAARIWKLTSEERDRILDNPEVDTSGVVAAAGTVAFSREFVEGLRVLFEEWRPLMGELWAWVEKNVLEVAASLVARPMDERELLGFLEDITPVRLRIRKLTERECFRLMDVDESDIDRIQGAGISRSGQYKLAGNSIVVAPMEYMFRNLLVEEYRERREANKTGQLSLFY